MGFSELEGKYPAGLELKAIVERRRERKTELQCMPPVVALASMFAEEGADGGRELMSFLTRSGLEIDPEGDFFSQIPRKFQTSIRLNHALIVFGVTVASIHEMLFSGELDGSIWCDRYNTLITGTLLPRAVASGESIERLSAEDLRTLRVQASQDKSLASFFNTHFSLLPKVLRGILETAGALPFIQNAILPLYRERAQFLLSPQV